MNILNFILWAVSGYSLAVIFIKKPQPLHLFIAVICAVFILPNILLGAAFLFHTHISTFLLASVCFIVTALSIFIHKKRKL